MSLSRALDSNAVYLENDVFVYIFSGLFFRSDQIYVQRLTNTS